MSGLKHELNGKHTFNSCNQQVLTHSFLLHPLTCLLNPMKEAVCCLWTRPQPQIYSGWEFVDVRAAGRCCLHSKVTPLWTEMPLCRLTERIHLPLISPYSHKHGARSRSSCLPACPAPPPYPRPSHLHSTVQGRGRGENSVHSQQMASLKSQRAYQCKAAACTVWALSCSLNDRTSAPAFGPASHALGLQDM